MLPCMSLVVDKISLVKGLENFLRQFLRVERRPTVWSVLGLDI